MTRSPQRRYGFTLVELLVVISVIGILVGMLIVTVGPMINRVSSFAIHNEATQLTASVEDFYNQHGFYPPSFVGMTSANDLLPYLNRIAPNHAEAVGTVGSRPIDIWWDNVGVQIQAQPGADLVFWLSGLMKNKQFPLTGGVIAAGGTAVDLPVAYNLSSRINGVRYDSELEREVYYEFQLGRLIPDASGVTLPACGGYEQPRGEEGVVFLYLDNNSYWFDANTDGFCQDTEALAYFDGSKLADHLAGTIPASELFENQHTFQIATYGVDGAAGSSVNWREMDSEARDNITNFSEGILEKMQVQ
ncbi:MAG: type II secretion system protein [Planctomycetota bacterium]